MMSLIEQEFHGTFEAFRSGQTPTIPFWQVDCWQRRTMTHDYGVMYLDRHFIRDVDELVIRYRDDDGAESEARLPIRTALIDADIVLFFHGTCIRALKEGIRSYWAEGEYTQESLSYDLEYGLRNEGLCPRHMTSGDRQVLEAFSGYCSRVLSEVES